MNIRSIKPTLMSIASTVLLFTNSLFAANAPSVNYHNISLREGLTQPDVTSIAEDCNGRYWIGTRNGLNSINAGSIKQYWHDAADSTSLAGNVINLLFSDSQGTIWVGSDNGLSVYDAGRERFVNYPIYPVSFMQLSDGVLIGCFGELIKYDNATDRFQKVTDLTSGGNPVGADKLIDLGEGKVLIANDVKGIFVYDRTTGSFEQKIAVEQNIIGRCTFVDSQGELWVSLYNIALMGYKVGTDGNYYLKDYFTTQNSDLSNNAVLDIIEVDNKLIVGTDGGGLCVFDLATRRFERTEPKSGEENIYKLPVTTVLSLYKDSFGDVWVGSVRCGLFCIKRMYMCSYGQVPLGVDSGLSFQTVLSITQTDPNTIYIGTDGGGVNRFDIGTRRFTHYPSTMGMKITGIARYNGRELLLSVFNDGGYLFDTQSGRLQRFNVFDSEVYRQLFNGNFYVTTCGDNALLLGSKMYVLNTRTNHSEQIDSKGNAMSDYLSVASDKGPETIIYSRTAIYSIDRTDRSLELINNKFERIAAVAVDNYGTLWIASKAGLERYSATENVQIAIPTPTPATIQSIVCTPNNRIWLGTTNGVWCYLPLANRFVFFNQSDGIVPNEYFGRAVLVADNGDIFMGGSDGLLQIDRDLPIDIADSTDVTLLSVAIDGQATAYDDLRRNHRGEVHISVPKRFNTVSITNLVRQRDVFAKTRFRYTICSAETKVSQESDEPTIVLHSLVPGNYTIKVACMGKDGRWSDPKTQMILTVEKPVLARWWTIILYIALAVWIIGLIIRVRNRAREREVELEIKESNTKLAEEKVQFMINVSHEIRTPLTLINAPLKRLLKRDDLSAGTIEELSNIYSQSQSMTRLVNMILDVRKMEKGNRTIDISTVNLNEFLTDAAEGFRNEYSHKQIDLSFDFDPTITTLDCDEGKCRIILSNMLMNALKYCQSGGKVVVRSRRGSNSTIAVDVVDNGIGLGSVDPEQLFMRFYRSNRSTEGYGIGLSYARMMVEAQGGTITAFNNPEGGATFSFSLPQTTLKRTENDTLNHYLGRLSRSSREQSDFSDISYEGLNRYSILVVDDNANMVELLRSSFVGIFKSVYTASNGRQALESIRANMPDMVVSDVMMPEMDGFELCRTIKQDISISHIPVVLLTARTDKPSTSLGYKLGADCYVAKPFDIDLLTSVIYNQLHSIEQMKIRFATQPTPISVEEFTFSDADEQFVDKLNTVIGDNLSNSELDVQLIATELNMSRSTFYVKLKALTGGGLVNYITKIRINRACSLLLNQDVQIGEIAEMVGFSSQQHFSKTFRNIMKISPTQYRAEHKSPTEQTEE